MIVASPQEPPSILQILRGSGQEVTIDVEPERMGADYLLHTPTGIVGIQRKTSADFIASTADGRLAHELHRLQKLPAGILLIEGEEDWNPDGTHPHREKWTRRGYDNLILSTQYYGFVTERTANHAATAIRLLELHAYHRQKQHLSLLVRPHIKIEGQEDGVWLLQGFPGIGPQLAKRIHDALGIPLTWTCTEQELCDLIGPKRGADLYAAL